MCCTVECWFSSVYSENWKFAVSSSPAAGRSSLWTGWLISRAALLDSLWNHELFCLVDFANVRLCGSQLQGSAVFSLNIMQWIVKEADCAAAAGSDSASCSGLCWMWAVRGGGGGGGEVVWVVDLAGRITPCHSTQNSSVEEELFFLYTLLSYTLTSPFCVMFDDGSGFTTCLLFFSIFSL